MAVYFQDGKWLFRGGAPVMTPECCCDGTPYEEACIVKDRPTPPGQLLCRFVGDGGITGLSGSVRFAYYNGVSTVELTTAISQDGEATYSNCGWTVPISAVDARYTEKNVGVTSIGTIPTNLTYMVTTIYAFLNHAFYTSDEEKCSGLITTTGEPGHGFGLGITFNVAGIEI